MILRSRTVIMKYLSHFCREQQSDSQRIIPLVPLFIGLWSLLTCAIKLPPSAIDADSSSFWPLPVREFYRLQCTLKTLPEVVLVNAFKNANIRQIQNHLRKRTMLQRYTWQNNYRAMGIGMFVSADRCYKFTSWFLDKLPRK